MSQQLNDEDFSIVGAFGSQKGLIALETPRPVLQVVGEGYAALTKTTVVPSGICSFSQHVAAIPGSHVAQNDRLLPSKAAQNQKNIALNDELLAFRGN